MERCVDISIERLDLYLNKSNLKEGAIQVIQHVRPEWPVMHIRLKIFTDGITNRLIGCYLENDCNDMVLIRVYGEKTELFIDRKVEVRNMRTMHKSGLTPPVYCTFNNGICYGFSPGFVLDEQMVRDSVISRLISEMLARMHTIRPSFSRSNDIKDCPQEPEPCLFRGLRKFLGLIPSALKDDKQDKRFRKYIPKKEKLLAEVNLLEFHLKKLGSPIVFCHNDLLLKNIVYNSDKNSVTFIDFEYGDYNYQAFDIGNHFCEFAGVDTYNPSLYPSEEFQIRWLRNYLEAWFAFKGRSLVCESSEKPSIENDVEILYNQVNHFSLAAHLYWGFWAVVQTAHSTIEFDFLGYGIQRLNEYYSRRDKLLNEVYH